MEYYRTIEKSVIPSNGLIMKVAENGFKLLYVKSKDDQVTVWYETIPSGGYLQISLILVETGNRVPHGYSYVDSTLMNDGKEYHVYIKKENLVYGN